MKKIAPLFLFLILPLSVAHSTSALSSISVTDITTTINLVSPPVVNPTPPAPSPSPLPPEPSPAPSPTPLPTPSPTPSTSPSPISPPSPLSSPSVLPSPSPLSAPSGAISAPDSGSPNFPTGTSSSVPVSTLTVTGIDKEGERVKGIGVIIDVASAASSSPGVMFSPEFKKLDTGDSASFTLKEGVYYVRGVASPESGLINSDEKRIEVKPGQTLDLSILFRQRDSVPSTKVLGIVTLADGVPADAEIRAWSRKGGYAETRSLGGRFELDLLSGDRWHISASSELGRLAYRSSEVAYEIGSEPVLVELVLVRASEELIPPSVNVRHNASDIATFKTEDGMAVSLPAESVIKTGFVDVNIRVVPDAPTLPAARPIGNAYDITISDSAGRSITNLLGEIEISLPYDPLELKAIGVEEDNIVPSYFDEDLKSWIRINNYTIDKDKRVVKVRVSHITRFALVSAADVVPPEAPKNVSAVILSSGDVKLAWENPKRDFDHAKIYRSQSRGLLGQLIVPKTSVSEFTDNTIDSRLSYNYTVRAVDPAGNESNNGPQAEVGGKIAITRSLRLGIRGDDVKILQEVMIREGLLESIYITGFFGPLTDKAVRNFQEKYASEILVPIGLNRATGVVGSMTRAKINALNGI